MSKRLILWGAGGHGKVVLEAAQSSDPARPVVFLDDDPQRSHTRFCNCEVLSIADLAASGNPESEFVICIGGNMVRSERFAQAVALGFQPAVIVHPTAYVSDAATIGAGSVILPRAVVNPGTRVGINCIINTGAIVEHDCHIEDHVHLSPAAVLGGGVHVGRFAHVGLNASLLPGAVIGENATIGAGAVVLKTIPAHATAVGVPARVLHFNRGPRN